MSQQRRNHFDQAGTTLTKCNDGSYCCGVGPDATDCCDNGQGTMVNKSNGQIILSGQITKSIAPATQTPLPSVIHTSSSRSSAITSIVTAGGVTTSPSSPSPSVSSSSSSGLSGGAKAGIAIGCVAGAALVGGLLFLLYRERQKRKAMEGGVHGEKQGWQFTQAPQYPPQEMGAYDQQDAKYHMRGEMDGQGRPQELPSATARL
ncbi:MAG: hypothetical protein Q9225_003280 [Loekoesia sp. 1 TL-2023]